MKEINTMELIVSAGQEVGKYKELINNAETEEKVKAVGNAALGFLNGMNVVINSMISFENNEFTGDFGEWVDEQEKTIRTYVRQRCVEIIDKKFLDYTK